MARLFGVVLLISAVFTFATADYKTDALDLHNKLRAEHHSPPLTLSNEVSVIQRDYQSPPSVNPFF